MSEAQVRADLRRVDVEEAAKDDGEIAGDDEEDDKDLVDLDDNAQGNGAQRSQASRKLTLAAFVILGLQVEDTQCVFLIA